MLRDVAALVKAGRDDVEDKVRQLIERSRKLEKEVAGAQVQARQWTRQRPVELGGGVGGVKVVATRVDGADAPALRDAVDQLKNKLRSAAIVLASVQDADKVVLIAGRDCGSDGEVKAGDLVNFVAQQVGGRGGGRADMAQAGGNDPAKLDAALGSVSRPGSSPNLRQSQPETVNSDCAKCRRAGKLVYCAASHFLPHYVDPKPMK